MTTYSIITQRLKPTIRKRKEENKFKRFLRDRSQHKTETIIVIITLVLLGMITYQYLKYKHIIQKGGREMKKAIIVLVFLFGIDFGQITDDITKIIRLPAEELNGG